MVNNHFNGIKWHFWDLSISCFMRILFKLCLPDVMVFRRLSIQKIVYENVKKEEQKSEARTKKKR